MQMIVVSAWLFFAHSMTTVAVEAQRYAGDPLTSPQAAIFSEIAYRDRRANKAEPTCEELRAMWIYSKRQSRAAETTNDLPMYRDPFSYNIWETYPVRSPTSLGYRGTIKTSLTARRTFDFFFFFHNYYSIFIVSTRSETATIDRDVRVRREQTNRTMLLCNWLDFFDNLYSN